LKPESTITKKSEQSVPVKTNKPDTTKTKKIVDQKSSKSRKEKASYVELGSSYKDKNKGVFRSEFADGVMPMDGEQDEIDFDSDDVNDVIDEVQVTQTITQAKTDSKATDNTVPLNTNEKGDNADKKKTKPTEKNSTFNVIDQKIDAILLKHQPKSKDAKKSKLSEKPEKSQKSQSKYDEKPEFSKITQSKIDPIKQSKLMDKLQSSPKTTSKL